MNESRKIPNGWELSNLQDAVDVLDNLRKPINSDEREKRISGKEESELYPYYGATGQVGWIDEFITDGEYVLIGEDGAPFLDFYKPKAYIIKGKTWVNNHAHILRFKEGVTTNAFILHFLNQFNYNGYVNGTTRLKLTKSSLVEIPFPLPPLPEQHRIVAKIEELFSSLDKGIESLKTAQQQLKVYRQAVLKWAFEELKSEKEIDEITHEHSIGLVRSNNQQNEKGIGLPYIKMNNVDLNGNVDFTRVVFVEVNNEEAEKFALKKGDILINTRNSVELVGKTGIVREEKPNCVFNNNLLRIRTKSEYNPLFIGYQLISPWLRKQMLKEKKATTNVCALYQRDIFPLKVKVTDSIKQDAIVAEIESRLSVCDKIEESIEQSLKQSESLRQSILKKAFEGKLVAQDPNDEPASVLLERIKAEREQNKQVPQPRRQAEKLKTKRQNYE